ncbi:CoA-transferase family III domain-containing protein [Lineolata rhizophorae]|uniref:CoA-transferase family III domain-containing protein n=1 Tax=Lineolata rhizophorae TaxID=578093 RepID=A0A6A6NUM0_9PEZI|nr:CoA-transferase family III domain-containing protein [Lineolata rhizophorae]
MAFPPPLSDIRVLEFAGLAPGPFAGLLMADFGATVLRIDRPVPGAHSSDPPPPTPDLLVRRKSSIAVNLKSAAGAALVKSLIPSVDVVIDPFRPGVLERLGLGPRDLMKHNQRLVVGRVTGFRRDGKYSMMAGHDINYLAVSGVLSMLGRAGDKPYPPANILGDFAGGGAMCFMGIVLALLTREKTGMGQVVEANMVDGSAMLATMPRLGTKTRAWNQPRGKNQLDGGAPWYDTYETKDGRYMAVGAIEPQFFAAFLKGLSLSESDLPGDRWDSSTWPQMRDLFAGTFASKTRAEWEAIFDGTDACCTPVLTQAELEESGFDQRPAVTLRNSPALAIIDDAERPVLGQGNGVDGQGWSEKGLSPGCDGEELLGRWMGWFKERQYKVVNGGLELTQKPSRL